MKGGFPSPSHYNHFPFLFSSSFLLKIISFLLSYYHLIQSLWDSWKELGMDQKDLNLNPSSAAFSFSDIHLTSYLDFSFLIYWMDDKTYLAESSEELRWLDNSRCLMTINNNDYYYITIMIVIDHNIIIIVYSLWPICSYQWQLSCINQFSQFPIHYLDVSSPI